MLSRLLFSEAVPALELPQGWKGRAREGSGYLLLGPPLEFDLLGQRQRAHLGYLPRLGHYLTQPIVLNMPPYDSPEAVFSAWNGVIEARDASMQRLHRDCPWQRELSRREFFGRLRERTT